MERNNIQEASRSRQIKKHLFENRKTLTEERFMELLDTYAGEIYEFAYESGWFARNIVQRACSTARRIRQRNDFSDLYSRHMEAIGHVDKTKPLTQKQLDIIYELISDWM